MRATIEAFKFLFIGPLIVLGLYFINWMTSPGHWWAHWAAFGIGIGWFFSLLRVLKAIIVAGGIAAFFAYMAARTPVSPRP